MRRLSKQARRAAATTATAHTTAAAAQHRKPESGGGSLNSYDLRMGHALYKAEFLLFPGIRQSGAQIRDGSFARFGFAACK